MSSRGTKGGAARTSLVEAALRLFDRHGFHGVAIDRILAEAGVAKMTLYHHFPSKDALVLAALERRDRDFRASFLAAVSLGAAPRTRLLSMFDSLELWIRDPAFHGSLFDRQRASTRSRSRGAPRGARAQDMAVR